MRSGMARVNEGSHSFTCHPHVYPRMEWTILSLLPNHIASPHFGFGRYSFLFPLRVGGWVEIVACCTRHRQWKKISILSFWKCMTLCLLFHYFYFATKWKLEISAIIEKSCKISWVGKGPKFRINFGLVVLSDYMLWVGLGRSRKSNPRPTVTWNLAEMTYCGSVNGTAD